MPYVECLGRDTSALLLILDDHFKDLKPWSPAPQLVIHRWEDEQMERKTSSLIHFGDIT